MLVGVGNDINGKKSGKRYAGFFCLFICGVISIIAVIQNPEVIKEIVWPWLLAGTTLLGATVLERKSN